MIKVTRDVLRGRRVFAKKPGGKGQKTRKGGTVQLEILFLLGSRDGAGYKG